MFRAIDEPNTCQLFMNGHTEVLQIFNITKITSANTAWFSNPNSFVIIAEDLSTGKIVGGARIHVVGGTQPLPIEDAVGHMDANIHSMVREHGVKGSGELCGLWNSREVAGMGVSFLLTRAGVAIAEQLKLCTLFIICADRTFFNIFRNQGFVIIKSLGNQGTFYYPKLDLLATAIIIDDIDTLNYAQPIDRERIIDLRNKPQQTTIEIGSKGILKVSYSLYIPKIWD